jgi:hypothetical protein
MWLAAGARLMRVSRSASFKKAVASMRGWPSAEVCSMRITLRAQVRSSRRSVAS